MDSLENNGNPRLTFLSKDEPHSSDSFESSIVASQFLLGKDKRESSISLQVVTQDHSNIHEVAGDHRKSESILNNNTAAAAASGDEVIANTTRDTAVILITLTILFFTLIATYLLWKRHRSSHFSLAQCKLEEYRYSRLSQNDVEVDNISFQGDLTHKTLMNSVPVCAEDDPEDGQIRPATLRLEYDSLVSISSGEKETSQNHSSTKHDDAPVNLLIDELSDEDLLQ